MARPLPFHDFGQDGWLERLAIWHGLLRVSRMQHLHQHARVVQAFEQAFSARHDGAFAIGVASGTDALYLALRQAGVRPGTEVVVSPNTWITTLTVIHELGATPCFIDVDPATGLMDPALIEPALTPRTVAVLPVHMYGSMVPMDRVMQVAQRAGLAVIEDACQAVGARYAGRPAGTWGDVGCFSFHTTKLVGAPGDGGLLLVRDAQRAEDLRRAAVVQWPAALHEPQPRVPSRLSPLQVPFLRVRLAGLAPRMAGRALQWRRYREGLAGLPGLRLLEPPAQAEASFRNCVVVTPARAEFAARCEAVGLPVESLYPQSAAFVERLCAAAPRPLPHALDLARHHLALPLGRQVGPDHIDRVIRIARDLHAVRVPVRGLSSPPQEEHAT